MPAPMCQNVLTLVRIIAPTAANAVNDVHRRNTLPALPTRCLATPALYYIYYIHKRQRCLAALVMAAPGACNAGPGIVNADLRLSAEAAMLIRGLSAACRC